MALQLRRGTNAQRLAVTPLEGELIVVTDYAASDVSPLWLGDGATVGGVVPITLELDDLTDVVLAELVDKQILQYDGLTGLWNNVSNPVLTGLTAGNITVGLTNDNTITTTTGNLTINTVGGLVTIDDNLTVVGDVAVNGGDVTTTSSIGNLFNTTATTVNIGNAATTEVNLGATSAGRVQIKSPSIVGANTTQAVFNTVATTVNAFGAANVISMGASGGTTILQGALKVDGNEIRSSTGAAAINLSGADVTVVGNLTVNGDLTYLNVSDLQVEDKNIIIAKGSTTDAASNGGGLTLKGATDKTINWYDAEDRWFFNNGDGVERPFVVTLNDLANVETTTFSDGQMLVARTLSPGNTQFINTSLVEFTTLAARPKFINAAGGTVSAEFLKRVTTAADGDTSGVFFGSIDGSDAKLLSQRITSEYDAAGNNILRVQSDSVGNFAPGSTTVKTQFYVDDVTVAANGTQLLLNANHTGTPTADVTIKVERGSETDATITWDESTNAWSISNTVFSPNIIAFNEIGTNAGTFVFNNDDGTPSAGDNASVIVRRGAGVDVVFRWNESTDRWESTTDGTNYISLPNQALDTGNNPLFAGATLGNVRVGITSDNEIDTTSGNLTIDSAGGTTTIDDAVVISGDLTHNGANATFNNNLTIGSSNLDTLTVNSYSDFNSGIQAGNIRIALTSDNSITTSTGSLNLLSDSGIVNVAGALDVALSIEASSLNLNTNTSSITIGAGTGGQIGLNLIQATTTTSTATTDLLGASFATTVYRSMEFTLQATAGTDYQVVKGVAIHDGTNTYMNTYSDIRTGAGDLFTVSATIAGGSFKLQVTSASATSTVYKGQWCGVAV